MAATAACRRRWVHDAMSWTPARCNSCDLSPAHSCTSRTYQQYIEDSLDSILHGRKDAGGAGAPPPAPAVQAAMKRAFSTSSDASALDAAAAAAAAAIPSSASAATPQVRGIMLGGVQGELWETCFRGHSCHVSGHLGCFQAHCFPMRRALKAHLPPRRSPSEDSRLWHVFWSRALNACGPDWCQPQMRGSRWRAQGQATAPKPPLPALKSGVSNLGPAPISLRSGSFTKASGTSETAAATKAAAAKAATAPLADAEAAVAGVGGNGGEAPPLPDLPPTTDIASGLYGLHVTEEEPPPLPPPSSAHPAAVASATPAELHPQNQQGPSQQPPSSPAATAAGLTDAVLRIVRNAGDAVKALSSPRRAGDAGRAADTPLTANGAAAHHPPPATNGVDRRSEHPAGTSGVSSSSSSDGSDSSGSHAASHSAPPHCAAGAAEAAAAPRAAAIPAAGAAAVGDRVLLCEERLDFRCSVEESPGMPWARAKFEVRAPRLTSLPAGPGAASPPAATGRPAAAAETSGAARVCRRSAARLPSSFG